MWCGIIWTIFGESLTNGWPRAVIAKSPTASSRRKGPRSASIASRTPRKGPVLLDEGRSSDRIACCAVRPISVLRRRVIEHSAIKDAVALGTRPRSAARSKRSIVEPYTNKQHHGFLGHSYLGSWINLGAGTCNSDLKNTYGHGEDGVSRRAGRDRHAVRRLHRWATMPRSAINTGIFTGKTIGCCSMLYGFVTTNVPSFVNYARLFGQVTELPPEVMVATQQRMFARRNVDAARVRHCAHSRDVRPDAARAAAGRRAAGAVRPVWLSAASRKSIPASWQTNSLARRLWRSAAGSATINDS